MAETIQASVGQGGVNNPADVIKIQRLLVAHGAALGTIDGICGSKTISAIRTFQAGFVSNPDGVVDPGGKTLAKLNEKGGATSEAAPATGITEPVSRDSLSAFNVGLQSASNDFMTAKLGNPRDSYNETCQTVTHPALKAQIKTANVGPFKVTGWGPAVDSLAKVMAAIQQEQPEVYAALGTQGMLCCRLVRGSKTAISNHSWGTAIDLTLNGQLDIRGDGKVQRGLAAIAPIFNRFEWYWGAGFRTEDAMHFEVSRSLLEKLSG